MAEDPGNKEDKFDQFTAAGESLGYITLEQARILAIQHARDNTDFYGPTYRGVNLVWEITSQEDGEDFYDIRLSFRPAGRFRGEPGVEQLIIDKTGSVQLRQILDEPSDLGQPSSGRPARWWLRAAVGLVVIGVVAVGGLIVLGTFVGGDEAPAASPIPTERPAPTAVPVPTVAPAVQVPPQRAPVATVAPVAVPGRTIANTPLTSSGYSFKLEYACIDRILEPCEEASAEGGFAQRVLERTNGQVDIQFTSFPELGVAGPDTLPLLEEGVIGIVEVYSGSLAGELPLLEIPNLEGLYPGEEAQLRVSELLREEMARLVEERSGGVVLVQQFYPSRFIFSRTPLETPDDFRGLRVRTPETNLSDLMGGMGADPQLMAFEETYTALEQGFVDAAITAPTAAFGQRWYEVSDYIVGPIPSLSHSWITINGKI